MDTLCRNCTRYLECYPSNQYVEIQLEANIKRDLCLADGKCDWVLEEDKSKLP